MGEKTKKIVELEKKLKEAEDKCKRNEKVLATRKDKVAKLEKQVNSILTIIIYFATSAIFYYYPVCKYFFISISQFSLYFKEM